MSARSLLGPQAPFSFVAIDRALRALERLALWRGTMLYDEVELFGEEVTTIQNVGAGTYPDAGATEIVSLELDPGRWNIVASVRHEIFVSDTSWLKGVGIILDWTDGISSGDERTSASTDAASGFQLDVQQQVALAFVAEAQATVSLKVFAGAIPGYTFAVYGCDFGNISAFPG